MPRPAPYGILTGVQIPSSAGRCARKAGRFACRLDAAGAPSRDEHCQPGVAMKTSQDRILTTHVGSLPRPAELRQLLVAKDKGEPYDKAELERRTRDAVLAIVRRQAATGVDIVNDGEMSKPGYSTYVADRLSGFAGHEPAKPRLDTRDHPNFMAAYERMTGANVARRSVCVGPVAVRDREPLNQDIANLRDALAPVSVAGGFMTAAPPGVVPVFQHHRHSPSHRADGEANRPA